MPFDWIGPAASPGPRPATLQRDAVAVVALAGVDHARPGIDDRVVVRRGVAVDGAVALIVGAQDLAVVLDPDVVAADVHRAAVAGDHAVATVDQGAGGLAAVGEVDAVEAAGDLAVVSD